MKAVYRDPRKLATCLKDLVETHLEGLVSYEKMEEKIKAIVEANGERIYKNGNMPVKIANMIGKENVVIIDRIVKGEN